MIINYSEIKKINFLEYEIDDEKNLNIINCFNELSLKIQEEKLEFIIAGGIASAFYYKKIYRTIKDIDIIINFKEIKRWFKIFEFLFSKNYEFITWEEKYHKDPYLMFKDFLDQKVSVITFTCEDCGCRFEFINSLNKFLAHKDLCIHKIQNMHILPINFHQKLEYSREKDLHDIEFFYKYLAVD